MGDARSYAKALLNRLIDIGRSLGSDTDTSGNVIMEVEGDPDEIDKQAEDFSHPAIIYKPYISTVPSVEGALKPLLLRAGNELLVIGGREMRWQVSVEPGEVVIRGLASGSNYIKFKTDGTILFGDGASEAVLKGDSFKTTYDTHTHNTAMGPSGVPNVLLPASNLSTINFTS